MVCKGLEKDNSDWTRAAVRDTVFLWGAGAMARSLPPSPPRLPDQPGLRAVGEVTEVPW